MIIGIDFDNTLVQYDDLFFKIALEKDLIPSNLERNKIAVRHYLNNKGQQDIFTILQGEIYGNRILEAKASQGSISVLKKLVGDGIDIKIISHKSKYPYKGPRYDLHEAAMSWLERNLFFSKDGINLNKNNVFFNTTKSKKIQKIISLGCQYFIDDLPEILYLIPSKINKILYYPYENKIKTNFYILKDWNQLNNIFLKN